MCRDLEVADRRMTAVSKLVLAEPLIAGAPSLVRQLMGDGVLNRCPFAQRGASALRSDLASELALELFVLTDVQAPTLADPGWGALRSSWTPITGAGGKLGVFAWEHRHRLTTRTGDRP